MESDPSIVILGFNDTIRFMQKPRLLDQQDETLDCRLYPFDANSQNAASIWILQTTGAAKRVVVDAHVILPSTSAKSIPHDKVWNLELNKLDCNIGKQRCSIRKFAFYNLLVRLFGIEIIG